MTASEYKGGSKAMRVLSAASHGANSFSASPVGPEVDEPVYQGVSPQMYAHPNSPDQWHDETYFGPLHLNAEYRGRSQAIHVFGAGPASWPPIGPIAGCKCCEENGELAPGPSGDCDPGVDCDGTPAADVARQTPLQAERGWWLRRRIDSGGTAYTIQGDFNSGTLSHRAVLTRLENIHNEPLNYEEEETRTYVQHLAPAGATSARLRMRIYARANVSDLTPPVDTQYVIYKGDWSLVGGSAAVPRTPSASSDPGWASLGSILASGVVLTTSVSSSTIRDYDEIDVTVPVDEDGRVRLVFAFADVVEVNAWFIEDSGIVEAKSRYPSIPDGWRSDDRVEATTLTGGVNNSPGAWYNLDFTVTAAAGCEPLLEDWAWFAGSTGDGASASGLWSIIGNRFILSAGADTGGSDFVIFEAQDPDFYSLVVNQTGGWTLSGTLTIPYIPATGDQLDYGWETSDTEAISAFLTVFPTGIGRLTWDLPGGPLVGGPGWGPGDFAITTGTHDWTLSVQTGVVSITVAGQTFTLTHGVDTIPFPNLLNLAAMGSFRIRLGETGSPAAGVFQMTVDEAVANSVTYGCTNCNSCPECEDPSNPGFQIPPFTPGYLPTFRRQIGDPTTTLDSFICTLESAAMVLDWHTRGAVKVWGGELIPYSGRTEASIVGVGTNLGDAQRAWANGWSQHLSIRSGQTWASLMQCLSEGRAVILQGDYGVFTLAERCQDNFVDNHAISVYPYQTADRLLVGDPICHNFKGFKISSLQDYAETLGAAVFGAQSPQPILFAVSRPWVP